MTTILAIFAGCFVLYAILRVIQGYQELRQQRQEDLTVDLRAQLTAARAEALKLRDRVPGLEPEDPTKAPWASIRSFTTYGEDVGGNTLIFPVSRHDVAECGLYCPRCKTMVLKKGQYDLVRRAYVNGVENEVVKCSGKMLLDGREQDCPLWLAASPDTEHGDHLRDDGSIEVSGENDPPEFYQFRRVDSAQVLKEQYGMDVAAGAANGGLEIDPKTRLPVMLGSKYDVLTGAELVKALHTAAGLKEALPAGAPAAKAPPEEPPPPPFIDPDATPPHPAPVLA